MRDIIYSLLIEANGNWNKTYICLEQKNKPKHCVLCPDEWICLIDEDYPEFLKGYYMPPFFVYKKNEKYYVPFGKDLKKKFEVKPDDEDNYIKNIKKTFKF